MKRASILFILTSHQRLGDTERLTGCHYEELATPYYLFKKEGYNITLASIKGGKPPFDPRSLKHCIDANPPSVITFLFDKEATTKLENTTPLTDISGERYDVLFLLGGEGAMWDFPTSETIANLVSDFMEKRKPVATIGLGAAGLIGAHTLMEQPIVKGKKLTCLSNAEEHETGLDTTLPFLLETAMRELGAEYECSEPGKKHVTQDENLITGQNAASAKGVAKTLISWLQRKKLSEAA
ncbi:MAG: ThiJ/PfpI domain protein [Rickettsiales bacterium]|jgi:putative intracellular protease/amidase|nr:ThiJ/PfpI domain protein [Rickettsiales bacterium]